MTPRILSHVALALALCASGCLGATPDDLARDALPDDGQSEGPLHRAGQPCLLCHSERGGTSPYFAVAGTVYDVDGVTPRVGVQVVLEDAAHLVAVPTTNSAGNFMVDERDWTPVFPITVELDDGANRISMRSSIGREGGCTFCHMAALSARSVGPVVIGVF